MERMRMLLETYVQPISVFGAHEKKFLLLIRKQTVGLRTLTDALDWLLP